MPKLPHTNARKNLNVILELSRRLLLLCAAAAEVAVVLLTPRVTTVNGQLVTPESFSGFPSQLDVRSILGYSLGILVTAALGWFALAPSPRRDIE